MDNRSTSQMQSMKKCPVCAEHIQPEAIICRYCRYDFAAPVQAQRPPVQAQRPPVQAQRPPVPGEGPTLAWTKSDYNVIATQPVDASARRLTNFAFVLSLIGLFLIPVLFGPAGAILGGIAWSKGDKLGLTALICGVTATFLGILIAVIVGSLV